jgi:alpha-L-rhamnosidase
MIMTGKIPSKIVTLAMSAVAIMFEVSTAGAQPDARATHLRCEYLTNPVAIEERAPRMSWIVESPERGWRQTAYRVLVASSAAKLDANSGDLWDSGKVASGETAHIEYAGKSLTSRTRCWWKVQVWNGEDKVSVWSQSAQWTVGLLKADDWKGSKWIGFDKVREIPREKGKLCLPPARFLRKDFTLPKSVARAMFYASAQGIFDAYLNGRKIGEDYFTPGWTDYSKRIYYRAYDVTGLLKDGANTVGAVLADGWFAGYFGMGGTRDSYGSNIRFKGILVLEYADGTTETVGTDDSWKAATGPILEADFFQGETYDARAELTGWSAPGYNASTWQPVVGGATMRVRMPDKTWIEVEPRLCAAPHEPVRIHKEHQAKSITKPKAGMYVLDMGSNFAGFARVNVTAPAGTKIALRFGERINEDGTIYTDNLRGIRATDTYICRGGGKETWAPQFTFHGFQYIEVTGWVGELTRESVVGIEVTSDAPVAGSFECSSTMANQLYRNICQTQRANFIDIPTDCPQRNERLGWTGDARAYVRTATYNSDVAAFFTKWLVDLADAQGPEGWYPKTAPSKHAGGDGGPAWADAGVICPWEIYTAYGDKRLIEKHYNEMAKFVAYRVAGATNLRPPEKYHCYGDWLSMKATTPKEVIFTAYFARSAWLMAHIAAELGKTDDAAKYQDLFKRIKAVFNKDYVDEQGKVKGDTQTGYILALMFDLVDGERFRQAGEHLVERIKDRNWHLSTGFVGTPDILPALTKIGRTDVAYRLFHTDTNPSWGFPIKNGATSMWEHWDSWTPEKGFIKGMNSFSHYSFGAVGRWMFSTIGGIDTESPGFGKIVIRPQPDNKLTYAKVTYNSIHGLIVSNWERTGDQLTMEVTIPANTTATIYVPAADPGRVTESGKPATQAPGVKALSSEASAAVFAVESGTYKFTSKLPAKGTR